MNDFCFGTSLPLWFEVGLAIFLYLERLARIAWDGFRRYFSVKIFASDCRIVSSTLFNIASLFL